jgi:DNA-binding transcriptional ArsR family regulator
MTSIQGPLRRAQGLTVSELRRTFHISLLAISESARRDVTMMMEEDRLSETFGALANSTRRAILARLAAGAATVNELAEPFELTLPAISKHIKVLERVGLVTRGQRAQYRPCALDASPLEQVSTWAEQYRPVWEARFDRMDDYLKQLRPQRKTGAHDD